MQVTRITIENFRGIAHGELFFSGHTVLVGDNNTGKSTILEAIDLVLGPDRLSRLPIIDEHDFFAGRYLDVEANPVPIKVEAVITDLSDEQKRHFKDHIEWWDVNANALIEGPPPEKTDDPGVVPALRVGFTGRYDSEEDDFTGETFFLSPLREDNTHTPFTKAHKRLCGFLFLRTLRTGSRALSLERGSLLDIILRMKEIRLQMWEEVLEPLRKLPVAEKPELGITDILSDLQNAIRLLVPSDWADSPHMRVSDLTRENLRRMLTVFMGTGACCENGTDHAAPFQHQGTGTINTLVLAMLSIIAEQKQNVIFAMEEPEIAIPPHTQKRIIDSVRKKSAQALFTSHSPYVLEEFQPPQILVLKRDNGTVTGIPADFPTTIKPKQYREEFRKRFAEALLARRILLTEGRTEYDVFPAAARRLHELAPETYDTLEALGIAVVDAATETQVAPLGQHFRKFGKTIFAVFDMQTPERRAEIDTCVDHAFEAAEKGFEKVILNGTPEVALRKFAIGLVADDEWPTHLASKTPTETTELDALQDALLDYFRWSKGAGNAADLIAICALDEIPLFIRETLLTIKQIVAPTTPPPEDEALSDEITTEIIEVEPVDDTPTAPDA